jgi:hypothetical protein
LIRFAIVALLFVKRLTANVLRISFGGALTSGGTAAFSYSIHRSDRSGWQFWTGWVAYTGAGVIFGSITGTLSSWQTDTEYAFSIMAQQRTVAASQEQILTAAAAWNRVYFQTLAARALTGGVFSGFQKVVDNWIDRSIMGTNEGTWSGVPLSAFIGAAAGGFLYTGKFAYKWRGGRRAIKTQTLQFNYNRKHLRAFWRSHSFSVRRGIRRVYRDLDLDNALHDLMIAEDEIRDAFIRRMTSIGIY